MAAVGRHHPQQDDHRSRAIMVRGMVCCLGGLEDCGDPVPGTVVPAVAPFAVRRPLPDEPMEVVPLSDQNSVTSTAKHAATVAGVTS